MEDNKEDDIIRSKNLRIDMNFFSKIKAPAINRYFFARTLGYFFLWGAVAIPYLLSRGLTIELATEIIAFGTILSIILEYPTGLIADTIGYKKTVIFGSLACALAMLIMAQNIPVLGYFLAIGLNSLGSSSYHGAEEGLLKELSPDFRKSLVNYKSIITVSAFLGSIVAGVLGKVDLTLPIYIYSILNIISGLILITLPNLNRHTAQVEGIIVKIKKSFDFVGKHKASFSLILFFAFLESFFYLIQTVIGSFNLIYSINVFHIGLILGSTFLIRAFAMQLGKFIKGNHIGRFVFLSSLLFCGSILAKDNVSLTLIFLLSNTLILSLISIKVTVYLNELIPDSVRASVLSLGNVIVKLLTAGLVVFLGVVSTKSNIGYLYILLVIIFIGLFLFFSLNNRGIKSEEHMPK